MSDSLISARNLEKSFQQGVSELKILKGVNLEIKAGESVAILGSSGAGKSTLLHILGTLDRPTAGQLFIQEQDLLKMSDEDLSAYRNEKMGFVFQFHHLLSEFTALENVMIPLQIAGISAKESEQIAQTFLNSLGLRERWDHYPSMLSGGELQRVAIARALVRSPRILLADEPTGNLDSQNSKIIQDLFFELKEKLGLTLIVVTHDLNFSARFSRVLRISDGQWV